MRTPPCVVVALFVMVSAYGCSKNKGTEVTGSEGGAAHASSESPSALLPLGGFEGELALTVQGPKSKAAPAIPLTLEIKGDKVRVDIPPGLGGTHPEMNVKGYAVLSGQEKKLSLVMDEQKQVLVIDLNHAADQLKGIRPPGSPPGAPSKDATRTPPKLTKNGTSDKVAGRSCDNWDVSEEGRKAAVLCIADEGASWFHFPTAGLPSEYAFAAELMDGKHFPLRAILFEKDGTEGGRMEFSKLEKKPVAATLFDVPSSYKVVDLATMFQQMAGMYRRGPGGGMPGAPGFPPGAPPGLPHKRP